MPADNEPLWLLAELTYRCVLECAYCSNPLQYQNENHRDELSGDEWTDVLEQARELGCLQLGLSGGEPLLHEDLEAIVAESDQLGFYSSLITAGTLLDRQRLRSLKEAGLNHVQVSLDGADAETNNTVTNQESFEEKLEACRTVRKMDFPLTLNVVLHAFNLDQTGVLIDLAAELDADRIELANAQYHGWALANRSELLPTGEKLEETEAIVEAKREKYPDLEIVWVVPDYYAEYPKACMGGWGNRYITVAPGGTVFPCHSADSIESLDFPSVPERSLKWIWEDSPAFNAFRGTDWMKEPCVSCPRKSVDYGGCRCQAFRLTGDARNADPVCHLSPDHDIVEDALEEARTKQPDASNLYFRNPSTVHRAVNQVGGT